MRAPAAGRSGSAPDSGEPISRARLRTPDELQFNIVNQLSFRVDSLATLKEMHEGLKQEKKVSNITTLTHGNALSCYFHDPENNRIELLIDTPWYVPQPHRLLVDLTLPDAELWALIEKHVRATPGFKPVAEWKQEIERKIPRRAQPTDAGAAAGWPRAEDEG